MVQAVLAFPRGTVLALTSNALYRSDDQGQSWRLVLSDNFSPYFQYGVNKMDRHPDFPWAFILGEYHSTGGANGAGTLWFYELDTGKKPTRLTTPQGTSTRPVRPGDQGRRRRPSRAVAESPGGPGMDGTATGSRGPPPMNSGH